MSFGPGGREHYNLYYIYAEDKEKNGLKAALAAVLWQKIKAEIGEKKPF